MCLQTDSLDTGQPTFDLKYKYVYLHQHFTELHKNRSIKPTQKVLFQLIKQTERNLSSFYFLFSSALPPTALLHVSTTITVVTHSFMSPTFGGKQQHANASLFSNLPHKGK